MRYDSGENAKRADCPLASVTGKISIQLIDDFPNHSNYVFDADDMFELAGKYQKERRDHSLDCP